MRLNFDILLAVMPVAPLPVVGRLMCTCRTLYQAGIPHALQGSISIASFKQLTSLYQFLCRDPHRSRYFGDLDVDNYFIKQGERWDESAAAILALLAEHGKYLHTISVRYRAPLFADFRLPVTLSSLRGLHSLRIRGYSEHIRAFILEARLPLTTLSLSFDDRLGDTMLAVDPSRICRSLEASLEVLHIDFVETKATECRYPRLHTLHITFFRRIDIQHLIRCFPGLSNLRFNVAQDNLLSDAEIERHRELNIEAQRHASWESLQSVECSLLNLYMLGVQTEVEHLDISKVQLNTAAHGSQLPAVVSDTRPCTLQLFLDSPAPELSRLGEFLEPAKDRLRTLVVTVCNHNPQYTDLSAILVSSPLPCV